jgi:hypothetical protein
MTKLKQFQGKGIVSDKLTEYWIRDYQLRPLLTAPYSCICDPAAIDP